MIENSLYCYFISRMASNKDVSRNIYGTENLTLFFDLFMQDDLEDYAKQHKEMRTKECMPGEYN